MSYQKKLKDITRAEWIVYYWIDATELVDVESVFIRGNLRPIEESLEAGKQFDAWLSNMEAVKAMENTATNA
jgi:hypothetical protein